MKRVKFASSPDIEEMETENEDPEVVTDKEPESTIVARAPSFYIGKPLKDYDASNGRVSYVITRETGKLKDILKTCLYGNFLR